MKIKGMFRSARTIIILVITLVLVVIILRKTDLIPSLSDIFSARPVRLEETPMVVREIHELAQLVTMSAQDEVVADSVRISTKDIIAHMLPIPNGIINPDKLVIVGRGRVVAGMDLKAMKEEDVHVYKDSVAIRLPKASILEVVMNPSDFNTFSEVGAWSPEAVTLVKLKARDILVKRALDRGLLQKAQARGELLMKNFLNTAGFKKVSIQY